LTWWVPKQFACQAEIIVREADVGGFRQRLALDAVVLDDGCAGGLRDLRNALAQAAAPGR